MILILFIYLASTYIFSGLVCCLAFLSNFNRRSSLAMWQYLLAVLASFIIVFFWPIWMIVDIQKFAQPESIDEPVELSRFVLVSKNTLLEEGFSKGAKP